MAAQAADMNYDVCTTDVPNHRLRRVVSHDRLDLALALSWLACCLPFSSRALRECCRCECSGFGAAACAGDDCSDGRDDGSNIGEGTHGRLLSTTCPKLTAFSGQVAYSGCSMSAKLMCLCA